MKKYWVIAGVVLLVIGFALFWFPYLETIGQQTVNKSLGSTLGGGGSSVHSFEPFKAEAQEWLDLDISASDDVLVTVKGQIVGEIFHVEGKLFKYKVTFDVSDVYEVEITNQSWFSSKDVSGNIYVIRYATYLHPLKLSGIGIILLGLGVAIVGFVRKPLTKDIEA